MTERLGTVLCFKLGVTPAQATEALKAVEPLLERQWRATEFTGSEATYDAPYRLETYDDIYGDPVWYIP